jgi:hypothetical protein
MNYMFNGTIFDKDISKWKVNTAINMESMFKDSIFNNDISSWNISKDCSTVNMFENSHIIDNYKPKQFKINEGFDFGSVNKKKVINAKNILDTILKRIDNREDIMLDQYELLINFTSIYRAKAGKLRNLVKYCIE